jgi:hypothetical protein
VSPARQPVPAPPQLPLFLSAPSQPTWPRQSATRAGFFLGEKSLTEISPFLNIPASVQILQNLYLLNRNSKQKVFYMFFDQKNV